MNAEKKALEFAKLELLLKDAGLLPCLTALDVDRWVVAHENAEKAMLAIKKCFDWRNETRVDEVLTNEIPPRVAHILSTRECIVMPEHVQDKWGRPVMVCNPSRHDKKTKLKDMINFMVYCLESICAIADRRKVRDICVIYDLANFELTHMDYKLAKTGIRLMMNYYPERLGALYIVNTPTMFYACYAIMQKWLYERTKEKVTFVSQRVNMDDAVSSEVLPSCLFERNLSSAQTKYEMQANHTNN